jgi:DNA polymerase-3 subunit epsilon
MKQIFYDLETTGVKFWKNSIHQLSGMIVIDGEIKDRFNIKMQPFSDAVIEDEALAIAGVTREDLNTYMAFDLAYKEFVRIINPYVDKFNKKDKFHLVGYNNASFDNQFLRAFFVQNRDNYFGSWFWSDTIDVMVLASQFLKDRRPEMENFKLATVAKFLGIDVDEEKTHDAMYDIELTMAIYEIVAKQNLV